MTDDLAYFESEDFQEILRKYEESVRSGHPVYIDADDLADIADYYQYNGHMEEADDAVNLALEYNPEAVGPLLYKAREAMQLKDYDTAEDYARRIEPTDALEALYLRGEILIQQGDEQAADEIFRMYLKDVMPDEQMDFVYDVAKIYSEYGLFEKAFQWVARSKGDDSDDFKELMARTLFGVGKYKDSEKIYNELIDHNPYSAKYWNALANAQFMNEDYNAALTSSEYAIAIDPDDTESLLSKANSLNNLENYESALSYFQKYSEKVDTDEYGFLYQGTCLINLGRYQEAIPVLEKAEEVSDKDSYYLPDIYQELAFVYSDLKMPETAIYYLDKTEDLKCDHNNINIIRGHILLANKRLKEAETTFRDVLAKTENNPKSMLRIIVSLYENRYIKPAYQLLKSFFNQVDDDWKDGYSYMARLCMEMLEADEFMYYLKKACEKNPQEAKSVLGIFFPEDLESKDYYTYALEQLKKFEG